MASRLVIVALDASSNRISQNLFIDSEATTADIEDFMWAYGTVVRVGIGEVTRDGVTVFGWFKDPEPGSHINRRLYLTYRVEVGFAPIPRPYYRFTLSDPIQEVIDHLIEEKPEPLAWKNFRLNALRLITTQGGAHLNGLLTATYSVRGFGLRAIL
jgi:hypothetical protein